jgi:2-oxoglutarate dehydrogenase E2 component (dihydrolipoamide succinyltransferase)
MSIEVKVPSLGESVTSATVGRWLKKAGEAVAEDEPLVELETDKVTVEVPAPKAGVLAEVLAEEGQDVEVGAVIARIEAGEGAVPAPASAKEETAVPAEAERPAPAEAEEAPSRSAAKVQETPQEQPAAPAAATKARISKEEALAQMTQPAAAPAAATPQPATIAVTPPPQEVVRRPRRVPPQDAEREERVKMSRLRMTIARRLKEAQNTAAQLTTFNEVDMTEIIALRQQYRELFQRKHGVKLGFMSFFVRAVTNALKEIPQLNAEIDGDEIIYKNYYHIGVAVGTERGLVVPVVREADSLSLAEIEKAIGDFAQRARAGTLKLEEMTGGTFTITNGGVYGSLMSTPILNLPQTGILGMHKIMQRPVVMADGSIQARPMMYLALTYDHRIVDGREAVTYLVRVKEFLEDPKRLILDL